jgi:hypothetical protein
VTTLTDPARELAELCSALAISSGNPGDHVLAEAFEVEAWSAEFYQIVFCIVERADSLIAIVSEIDLDEDYRTEAVAHIRQIKAAFNKGSLMNPWNNRGTGASLLAAYNVQPVKMLSPMVRSRVSYPKLDDVEIDNLIQLAEEFQNWLSTHQLREQDFIRQALLDGIRQFCFRLAKTKWLGWGYTIQSLKDVIAAYKMLEGGAPGESPQADAEAVLRKGSAFFVKVFQKLGVAKDAAERADFLLKAYGAISLVQGGTTVTGLLTHLNG